MVDPGYIPDGPERRVGAVPTGARRCGSLIAEPWNGPGQRSNRQQFQLAGVDGGIRPAEEGERRDHGRQRWEAGTETEALESHPVKILSLKAVLPTQEPSSLPHREPAECLHSAAYRSVCGG
jgi:hypothetical protein